MSPNESDRRDRELLAGRCGFCGAVLDDGSAECYECGRSSPGDGLYQLRRPRWMKAVAWILLVLLAAGLAGWIVNLVLT